MISLAKSLLASLKKRQVGIDVPDDDTILLHRVPTHRRSFNKPCTNALIKRTSSRKTAFVIGVDEDLDYVGRHQYLRQVFSGTFCRNGWQIISIDSSSGDDFEAAVRWALSIVGFSGAEPSVDRVVRRGSNSGRAGRIAGIGVSLTDQVRHGTIPTVLAREEEVEEAVSFLRLWGQPRILIIAGQPEAGKTTLLRGIARRLLDRRAPRELICIDLVELMIAACTWSEREAALASIMEEVFDHQRCICALEHIELVLSMPNGKTILAKFAENDSRMVGTTLPRYVPALRSDPLTTRVAVLSLHELEPKQTERVLLSVAGQISRHHKIQVNRGCIRVCLRVADKVAGCFPGKAVRLLDLAAATAARGGAVVVAPDDVYYAAERLTKGDYEEA